MIPFQKVGLSADDLAESTGLDIYKFRVDLPKGQRFRVVLRAQQDEKSPAPETPGILFQTTADEPTIVRVSFIRMDRKLQGFLLSNEPQAEYRVNCSGGTNGGFATIVANPLAGTDATNRGVFAHQSSEREAKEGLKETRLLSVAAHKPDGRGVDMSGYPRGEVVIRKE